MDEFLIDWAAWLPTWPSLLSNGLIPLALVLLFLVMLDEAVRRMFHTDTEERILFIFVFLFVALAYPDHHRDLFSGYWHGLNVALGYGHPLSYSHCMGYANRESS